MTPVFETARLLLRRLEPGDLDALCALYSDPEIRRFFPEGTLDREQTREELQWFTGGGDPAHPELGLWATIQKETGAFIGRCGMIPWTIEGRVEIEIAYLLDKAWWRQGLGAEAARGLVRHGFERLRLSRLIALIDPLNLASQRTALRAGLTFDRRVEIEGEVIDIHAIERNADLTANAP